LAYLLGLEGIALLRAFAGEYDRDFTMARLAEIRALLDSMDELGDGAVVDALPTTEGYGSWAEFCDEAGNQLIELEQPIVWEILEGLPAGAALDAACGTGRHSACLAALGHTVTGVDSSPAMLKHAREKVPDGEFHEADLHELPLPDDHVDLVVCALALMHVPDLEPVLAELVRVLRPGGSLVISDWRILVGDRGLPVVKARADGSSGYIPTWSRRTSEYLAAALPLGLHVRRCEDPCDRSHWSTTTAGPMDSRSPITSPGLRRTSGHCIAGVPRPPTLPTAGHPSLSSGTSSSAEADEETRNRYGRLRSISSTR
jgi:ubiquinone/menaquinone biosynthesis C-methylase UbiE